MSKPKPGLGKGIVRTLAVAQHPQGGVGVLTLAPVVSQYGYAVAASAASAVAGSGGSRDVGAAVAGAAATTGGASGSAVIGRNQPSGVASGWPILQSQAGYDLSLVPTWDQPEIVLSYSARGNVPVRLRANLRMPFGPVQVSSSPTGRSGAAKTRRYSTAVSSSAFLTSPLPPSMYSYGAGPDRGLYAPTPAQSSLDALLAALDLGSFSSNPGGHGSRVETDVPLPPDSPTPRSANQSQTLKPRSSTHSTISSTSNPSPSTSPIPSPVSFAHHLPQDVISPTPAQPTTYSSSLIFHLGASGLPKERLPPKKPPTPRPDIPPRQRSFPLPDVTPPTAAQLRSTSVGEDAYFTRGDGMCIADGVGAWARSGRGGADAGRWSRLLTHFCEEEVGDWWAGKTWYLAADQGKGKGKEGEGELKRRSLDPVEIMQRGYEKCLSCAIAEGINGSSTCLLALLHNSTLHIANLGDCCLLVIRQGEVVFRTAEMQHAFNFPHQVGTHSRDEPMKDAMRYDVGVKKGDVVVLGSDGLMDNLFDEDILDTLSQFQPSSSSASSSSNPLGPASLPFSPQRASDALCRRARAISELVTATTPFMCAAIEEGMDFVGGKKDDISVLVGVVGDREGGGEGEGKEGKLALHM
ncbi:hypothetical protein IAT38_007297 [Cryptococcus sp. DSM 104549]